MSDETSEHGNTISGNIHASEVTGKVVAMGHQAKVFNEEHYGDRITGSKIINYSIGQTTPELPKTISPPEGYIRRKERESKLTELLLEMKGSRPIVLSGMSGTGKTWLASQVIHELQQKKPPTFSGILWESLADMEPHHLLYQWFNLLGNAMKPIDPEQYHSPRRLLWDKADHYSKEHGCLLAVFDDVQDEQQLEQLLPAPNQPMPDCSILVICTWQPHLNQERHRHLEHLELKGFQEQEVHCLFQEQLGLDPNQLKNYKEYFDEIVQRLGALPLLVSTAAHDMANGKIFPGAYVRSLREQDNPGSRIGRAVVDGLKLALRDLSEEQRNLFTFVGVLGNGSWLLDMLAAIVIRRPTDIQSDLNALVRRGLIQLLPDDGRYKVNAVVREFAQQLLEERSPYVRDAAYTCLAYYCLNYTRRLALTLMERPDVKAVVGYNEPHHHEYFVAEYHNLISSEILHIQQVMKWARREKHWHLLRQFADVSSSELLRYFVANSFAEIRMNFSLATIVEPIVRNKGVSPKEPEFQSFICTRDLHYVLPNSDGQPVDDNNHPKPELVLNIQAGRIIDGFFEDVCFLDNRWSGVRAARLICRNFELIGCEFIACDLSQSVWVDGDARQLVLTGSILRYALLHNVRLHRANLRDADMTDAVLEKVKLRRADLRNCNLKGALLDNVDLRGADLRGAQVEGAIFHQVNRQDCRDDGINWEKAWIVQDDAEGNRRTSAAGSGAYDTYQKHSRVRARNKLQDFLKSSSKTNQQEKYNFTESDLRAFQHSDLEMCSEVSSSESAVKSQETFSDCSDWPFSRVDFRAARLANFDFSRADLQGADLRGAILYKPTFQKANMCGADLRATLLIDANLEESDLTSTELRFAIIRQGRLKTARMRAAQLHNATLACAQLQKAELIEVDFSNANLERAELQGANLSKANLRGTSLVEADLSGANLHKADCDKADFTNAKLEEKILVWATSWRGATLPSGRKVCHFNDSYDDPTLLEQAREHLHLAYLTGKFESLNLEEYNLLGAQLSGDFFTVNFTRAIFDSGRLSGVFAHVNFANASLRAAHLSGIFTETKFNQAALTEASLNGIFYHCSFKDLPTANLHGITFEEANLAGCDFSGSQVDDSLFQQAYRMRGCTMPDGTRYNGQFNLPGDRQDALKFRYDLTKPEVWSEFYSSEKLTVQSNPNSPEYRNNPR